MSINSNIPVSCSIIPGKKINPEIEEFRAVFNENKETSQNFEEFLVELAGKHFTNAFQHMMPVIKIQINKINISIDSSGNTTSAIAKYHYGKSDAGTGHYFFTASTDLILIYLRNHFYGSLILPEALYVWEHEIIHMLDHDNIVEFDDNLKNYDGVELLVRYILNYRFEGIAELYYLLKGYSNYRSIKAARTQFLKRMEFLRNRPWDNPKFSLNMFRWSSADKEHYSLGNWMMLHILGSEFFPEVADTAAEAAIKIRKRQAISEEDAIKLIHSGIEMNNHTFITGLTKPGPDGKAFVDHDEFEDLAGYVEYCVKDMNRVWSRPSQLHGNPRIIELFRLLRTK